MRKRKSIDYAKEQEGENTSDNDEVAKPKAIKHMFKNEEEKRLVVVLDNASLEVVKTNKGYELLNCDRHRHLMSKLSRDPSKVRPDIAHQCLLMLFDSPLNKAKLLQVFIRTDRNVLIQIHPLTRIPRTFDRFCGLMVQLLHKLSVQAADTSVKLMKVIKNPVTDHFPVGCRKIGTSFAAGAPVHPRTLVPNNDDPVVVVIGAFAHGHIQTDYCDEMVSISSYGLSAALTCAKFCTAFEEVWGVL